MSCEFTIGYIDLDESMVPEVKKFIEECNLECVLKICNQQWVQESSSNMSSWTATEITDTFLPKMAKLLAGTPRDGQLIETSCDGEKTLYLLSKGEIEEIHELDRILTGLTGVTIGLTTTIELEAEVIGIGLDRMLVTKLKRKGG